MTYVHCLPSFPALKGNSIVKSCTHHLDNKILPEKHSVKAPILMGTQVKRQITNKLYMAPAIAIIKQAAVSGNFTFRAVAVHIAISLIPFLEEEAEDHLHSGDWAFSQGTCLLAFTLLQSSRRSEQITSVICHCRAAFQTNKPQAHALPSRENSHEQL